MMEEEEVDQRFDGVSVHTQADDHCLSAVPSHDSVAAFSNKSFPRSSLLFLMYALLQSPLIQIQRWAGISASSQLIPEFSRSATKKSIRSMCVRGERVSVSGRDKGLGREE